MRHLIDRVAQDDGAAPVEFALVTPLVLLVALDLPLIGLLGPTPMTVTGRSVLEPTRELPPGFSSEW